MTLKAISFDLWDTVLDDESDEPERLRLGLQSKPETRHRMLLEALERHHDVSRAEVDLAYAVANAAFYKVWQEASVTWTCRERLEVLLKGLGKPLPDEELTALSEAMGRLEVQVPPKLLPGVAEAIAALSQRYDLVVVSDTIVTPADGLRQILNNHGLWRHFKEGAFSDEVGRSKPHPEMFEKARLIADVDFDEMLHIGDRDNKDIAGAQALGMKAVLYTGKRDADRYATSADAVCTDHTDLPGIIDALSGD